LLAATEKILGDGVSYARVSRDQGALDEALGAAACALSAGAGSGDARKSAADAAREHALALGVGGVRSARKGAALEARAPAREVSVMLRALRSFSSLEDVLEGAPGEVHRVGFERVMVSRIEGSLWLPRSCSVADDAELARALVEVGAQYPGTLNGSMVEADVVRRVRPILVRDARGNARVHKRLRDVIDSRAYVTAPLVVHGVVAGLIHADRNPADGTVDPFDLDIIAAVAEGLGCAIERVVFLERLNALRATLDEHTRMVGDLIDEFVSPAVELSPAAPGRSRPVPPPRPVRDDLSHERDSGLTRRELDVLRRMAAGETNVQIAHRLYLSEGTVKSHVKHILRKLDAANRAEAVSRYHLTMRDPGYSAQ
jgi:DNA-binding CsgD family transcriptional regulator